MRQASEKAEARPRRPCGRGVCPDEMFGRWSWALREKLILKLRKIVFILFYSTDFPPKSPEGFRRFLCSVNPVKTPLLHLCTYRKRLFLNPANLARIHFRETEALATEVLERCADEVEFLVVDDEEAVVV